MQKIDFATLPVSVSSWIVLRDCFQECGDPEMLYKIIDDYYSELPLYEIYRLFYKLVETADDAVFQHALDYLFSQILLSVPMRQVLIY